jgi:D-lyxose ketol-isomerase
MKRSEINAFLRGAESFFQLHQFNLPSWCRWGLDDWAKNKAACEEIFACNLGWDITDFGSNDFLKRGLLLITLRNGNPQNKAKPYAEKIMIVGEGQETPLHFHWSKQEDIINRGGGKLVFELYQSTKDEGLSMEPFTIQKDGLQTVVDAGKPLVLDPGESITLDPFVYHRFYALPGTGSVLCGEVSAVNDDAKDNRFYEQLGRFPSIGEDESPYRLLVNDYSTFIT